MRKMLMLGALAAALDGRAQSDASLSLADKTVTFTNLQGQVYQDAALIRADYNQVIFKTNDLFGTVALTNLSPATLGLLGIPPGHLAKAQELDRQKKEAVLREQAITAEERRLLLDPANLVPVKVEAVLNRAGYSQIYGDVFLCKVRKDQGDLMSACVSRLPSDIAAYYSKERAMEDSAAQLGGQLDTAGAQLAQRQRQVETAEANTPTVADANFYYNNYLFIDYDLAMAQRRQLDAAHQELKDATNNLEAGRKQLDELNAQLSAVKSSELAVTTRLMLPSRRAFNGVPIFICAPEAAQTKVAGDPRLH